MIKPMFGHTPKPRKFDLPLRYYDPEEERRRKRTIRFERKKRPKTRQGLKVFVLALGLFMVLWIIRYLSSFS
ncbi:MAG: hypothetical protein ACO363_02825 [Balneolaceae bacterium]|jgi:hypothetical protein